MKKAKKGLAERLIYNNKFLLLFSVFAAILLWATVKINYSTDTTRVVSEVKVTLSSTSQQDSGYKYFVDDEDLYVDVEISGKAYNINPNSVSKDDIIVTTSEVYADSAGYKVLSLNARFANAIGNRNAQIVSVTPSTIAVYYDMEVTETVNVEAVLTNSRDSLLSEGYSVGNPVPSMNTLDITGPATVLSQLNKVYFQATIDEDSLPLTTTATVSADIRYDFNSNVDSHYLTYEIAESNPPTVTVTVKSEKEVPTAVKFINEPSAYSAADSNIRIDPQMVTILCNTGNADNYDRYIVKTVDFRELKNDKNVFEVTAEESSNPNLLSEEISSFTVTVDFSSMKSRGIAGAGENIVLVNDNKDFDYDVDLTGGGLENICFIGPAASLAKITAEDIQIEINVSGLDLARSGSQVLEVSNISIQNEEISDCWAYGKYTATVTATAKAQ